MVVLSSTAIVEQAGQVADQPALLVGKFDLKYATLVSAVVVAVLVRVKDALASPILLESMDSPVVGGHGRGRPTRFWGCC